MPDGTMHQHSRIPLPRCYVSGSEYEVPTKR